MMHRIVSILFGSIICWSAIAGEQEITFLSDLAEPVGQGYQVYSNYWWGGPFATGRSPAGYWLDSIQLSVFANGTPAGNLSVNLFSTDTTQIFHLTGTNPVALGIYTYTATNIWLRPRTIYIVAVNATSPQAQNGYYWTRSVNKNYVSSDNWLMVSEFTFSVTGTNWIHGGLTEPFQFAINATPGILLSGCITNNGFDLKFNTFSNLTYTVQYKSNLADASWTFLTNFSSDSSNKSITVPATNHAQFFRASIP